MRGRCQNPKARGFARYGGRGIKVCSRWDVGDGTSHPFELFLQDLGPRPVGTSLDRKDNDGDYEPANCRWATPEEQANNTSHNRRYEYLGELHTVAELSRLSNGVNAGALNLRLTYLGWNIERAMTEPVAARRPFKPRAS